MSNEQNRRESPADQPTPSPHDAPGSAQGQPMTKADLASQTGLKTEDIVSPEDTGAMGGREDLAGAYPGDSLESDRNIKNTEDTRGGGGTGEANKMER